MYYIGIDLGTTNVKLILLDEKGQICRSFSDTYPLDFPAPGWSEQSPEDWWEAVVKGLKTLTEGIPAKEIRGIGCGGQMHGLVVLDNEDRVIRPAILWNDGRTAEEVEFLNSVVGTGHLMKETANIAFAGFTAPKLLWMRKHEPENFKRICKIMLPKDYINYKLTGMHVTDYSDAGGMLLLDVEHRDWSEEMLSLCNIRREQMPKLYESYEVVGTLLPEVAAATGLEEETTVVAGAGDNAAAAIGTGTVKDGDCNISLGTSGTLFIASDRFTSVPGGSIHAFPHATGKYHLMGCMLSAASCNMWFCDDILKAASYAEEQADISEEDLGRNHVMFLPYLMGERSPINDTNARGSFVGMRLDTTRKDMVQAVLEGVAFGLRDSLEVIKARGLKVETSGLCGGGSRSALWQKIIANVLGIPLTLPRTEEGPAYGGAMLAMVGTGLFADVPSCCEALLSLRGRVEPDPEITARYEKQYRKFRKLYPALKNFFSE
ncbi:MAG: xylulokinase [Lachnospiraceae bacterium]|nr:xylulokinase [Lachnospiraceae bacterium]